MWISWFSIPTNTFFSNSFGNENSIEMKALRGSLTPFCDLVKWSCKTKKERNKSLSLYSAHSFIPFC